MTQHDKCLICDSDKLQALRGYEAFYLCKCRSCSFVFSRRVPSSKELEIHYEEYGRNDYLSPITVKRYHELLDTFEQYRQSNKLIDIGCGIGYFLEAAKERGWEVYGTEYTNEAVSICKSKGIKMTKGAMNINQYSKESFDIVTSFEVIEHINNPNEELTNFYQLLRPSGIVYVTTPNFNSLQRSILKDKYNIISYPEHLCYYSPKTLLKLFKQHGFRRIILQSTGISLTRLKTSMKMSNEDFISEDSSDEKLRHSIEENPLLRKLKTMANYCLTLFGRGDSLKGIFQKAQ